MTNENETVKQLVKFIQTGQAFSKMKDCLEGIPVEMRGAKTGNMPHSLWELVEHMRITQWDILDFSRNPDYKGINWPTDYWPKNPVPTEAEWDKTIKQIFEDQEAFVAILESPDSDLFTPFPWGKGQNLLREAMLIANHNSHHLGQVIWARKMLGIWG